MGVNKKTTKKRVLASTSPVELVLERVGQS